MRKMKILNRAQDTYGWPFLHTAARLRFMVWEPPFAAAAQKFGTLARHISISSVNTSGGVGVGGGGGHPKTEWIKLESSIRQMENRQNKLDRLSSSSPRPRCVHSD